MLRRAAHFFLIGAVLFVGQRALRTDAAPPHTDRIALGTERIRRLEAGWRADTGRTPDNRERAALINGAVNEELLFHAAIDLGLHRTDAVVWHRLARNMRFLSPDSKSDDSALVAQAYALGMDRTDIVVRRRLIERMRQLLAERGRGPEPTEAELLDYIRRHPYDFTAPARVTIRQRFASAQRRGDGAAEFARKMVAELRNADSAANIESDASYHPERFESVSRRDLAKAFGTVFADKVMAAPVGRWIGPVESAYGAHAVFVETSEPAHPQALEAVRDRARYGLIREREALAIARGLEQLRRRYEIDIAGEHVDAAEQGPS